MAVPASVIDTLIAEAGNNPDGLLAVAYVIRNRAYEWGMTADEVVKQKNQFEGYSNPGAESVKAQKMPAVRAAAEAAWNSAITAAKPDPTSGALSFRAAGHEKGMASPNGTVNIGGNVFALGTAKAAPKSAPQPAPGRPASMGSDPATTVFQTQGGAASVRTADIDPHLQGILNEVSRRTGVVMQVYSGGQNDETGYTGSVRHDHGKAADVRLYRRNADGSLTQLDASNPADIPLLTDVAKYSYAYGANGVGMGPDYMGDGSMHIGFGTNPANHGKAATPDKDAFWGGASFLADARDQGVALRSRIPPMDIPMVASETDTAAPAALGLAGSGGGIAPAAAPVPRSRPAGISEPSRLPVPTPSPSAAQPALQKVPAPPPGAPRQPPATGVKQPSAAAPAPVPAAVGLGTEKRTSPEGRVGQQQADKSLADWMARQFVPPRDPAEKRETTGTKQMQSSAPTGGVVKTKTETVKPNGTVVPAVQAGSTPAPAGRPSNIPDVPKYITTTTKVPIGKPVAAPSIDDARKEQMLMRNHARAKAAADAGVGAKQEFKTVTTQVLNPEWIKAQAGAAAPAVVVEPPPPPTAVGVVAPPKAPAPGAAAPAGSPAVGLGLKQGPMFTRMVSEPRAGEKIMTQNHGVQVIGQRLNNSSKGRTVSGNEWFNSVTGL